MINQPALLALADGSLFPGVSIGYQGKTVGEVVFNTAMTGYQEILTDPSYAKQIVTLTYPHIGNVGVNTEDRESSQPWAAGLIMRDYSTLSSNWRSQETLSDYLREHQIVAIAQVDTRRLTRLLREKGAQNGCIMTVHAEADAAIAAAKAFAGLKGMDLAREVSVTQSYGWKEGNWQPGQNSDLLEKHATEINSPQSFCHVVVYDFGVKQSILRQLCSAGCHLTVVPAQTPASEVLALKPDGILLSNGPGDPEPCDYAIAAIRTFLESNIPLFGICLGHQLLGLACGAKTIKMKFGHHGANHPVQDLRSGKVMITSQNHGFSVDEATLPEELIATHRSLFDHSLQGIHHRYKPAFSFQGHPEASPGPHDVTGLFQYFIDLMRNRKTSVSESHST